MPILTSCCCWEQLTKGSRATALFTLVSGVINFIIDVWMLVHLHQMDKNLEDNEKFIFLPPGIIPLIYIELFASIGLILVGMVLWVGINYGYDGKRMVFGWVYYVIASRCYEFFLMVYILVWIGGHRVMDIVYVVPESIGITVFWLLDSALMIAGILCVISYWQELMNFIYGKAKKARRFTKLSNIRNAAYSASGRATPRSLFASRAYLGASQPSIAQFSQFSVPPSNAPSVPQSAQPMGPGAFEYPPHGQPYPQKGGPPPGAQAYPQKGGPPPGGQYRGPPPQGGLPQGYLPQQRGGPPPQGYRGPPPQGYRGPPPQGYRGPPPQGYRGPPPQGYRGPPPQGNRGPPLQGNRGPPPRGGPQARQPPPQQRQVQQYFDDPPPKY